MRAGDAALAEGRSTDAFDFYTEAISKAPGVSDMDMALWRLKRAAVCANLNSHEEAVEEAKITLHYYPDNYKALRLLCTSSIELGDWDTVENTMEQIHKLPAKITYGTASRTAFLEKVLDQMQQNMGDCDFGPIARKISPNHIHCRIADFVEGVKITPSSTYGRGLFTKQTVKRGDVLFYETAIALSTDDRMSSFEGGLGGLLGTGGDRDFCSRQDLALLQHLARTTLGCTHKLNSAFDLPSGGTYPFVPPRSHREPLIFDR
jgi:tetratricopeptide (TPR) repeat protein